MLQTVISNTFDLNGPWGSFHFPSPFPSFPFLSGVARLCEFGGWHWHEDQSGAKVQVPWYHHQCETRIWIDARRTRWRHSTTTYIYRYVYANGYTSHNSMYVNIQKALLDQLWWLMFFVCDRIIDLPGSEGPAAVDCLPGEDGEGISRGQEDWGNPK